MKKGGGKQKGASFERQVCTDLSRFVDPDGSDTLYWRSAMSGGRATVQARSGVRNSTQLGDITCVHPRGEWLTSLMVIECKFYKDLNFGNSILFKKGNLYTFWKQVKKIAKKNDRHPLLIAKQNKSPAIVVFDKMGLQSFTTLGNEVKVIATSLRSGMYIALYDQVFKNE